MKKKKSLLGFIEISLNLHIINLRKISILITVVWAIKTLSFSRSIFFHFSQPCCIVCNVQILYIFCHICPKYFMSYDTMIRGITVYHYAYCYLLMLKFNVTIYYSLYSLWCSKFQNFTSASPVLLTSDSMWGDFIRLSSRLGT